jgi:hypothetical protein
VANLSKFVVDKHGVCTIAEVHVSGVTGGDYRNAATNGVRDSEAKAFCPMQRNIGVRFVIQAMYHFVFDIPGDYQHIKVFFANRLKLGFEQRVVFQIANLYNQSDVLAVAKSIEESANSEQDVLTFCIAIYVCNSEK